MSDAGERFSESTNLKYGVVEDSIPEEDIYRGDEQPVIITQMDEGREYRLHIGSRVGLDTAIKFDTVDWHPGEYQGTLFLERTVGEEKVTAATLDWHAAEPRDPLGLVGEWFRERINLSEYYAGIECPECGGELLHFPMSTECEEVGCDLYVEGHIQPPDDETADSSSTGTDRSDTSMEGSR